MPSPMKQSVLSFSSPTRKTPLSRSNAVEVVVIDDSDDEDGLRTPPPGMVLNKRSSGIVIELIKDDPRPYKVAQSCSSAAPIIDLNDVPKKKEVLPKKKKKPSGDNATSSSSSQQTGKDGKLKATSPASETRVCHQHRNACSNLLRCTSKWDFKTDMHISPLTCSS
jgi:hypothetical protein